MRARQYASTAGACGRNIRVSPTCPTTFEALGLAYDHAERGLARGRVGRADTRLLAMRDLVDFAADWMGRHRVP
ncbi:AAC(3) family N-acetyltransferase [Salinisphaera sp.]|uniref:AAC(3) family N-acetyltransferase n=1 Tax=Salinisphaera sp. TaxID=1914330 RepID=UPI003C7CAA59